MIEDREISPEMKVRRAKQDRKKEASLQQFLTQPPQLVMPKQRNPQYLKNTLPTVEEPICVLKIELDGHHLEEIKVFENDDPGFIVHTFGE